jgi:hypothetical protein
MNFRKPALELVEVIRIYRDGREKRERMPRWLAEMSIGCISREEPDVARARIELIHVDEQAPYSVRSVRSEQMHQIALQLAVFLPARLAA